MLSNNSQGKKLIKTYKFMYIHLFNAIIHKAITGIDNVTSIVEYPLQVINVQIK